MQKIFAQNTDKLRLQKSIMAIKWGYRYFRILFFHNPFQFQEENKSQQLMTIFQINWDWLDIL